MKKNQSNASFGPLQMLLLFSFLIALGAPVTISAQTKQDLTYDEAGRVSSVKFTSGGNTNVINYTYDKRSNLVNVKTEVTVVSVEEDQKQIVLTVRPNPTASDVTIEAEGTPGMPSQVTVTTSDGRGVFERTVVASAEGRIKLEFNSDAEGLASGTYVLTVRSKDYVASVKLVIGK